MSLSTSAEPPSIDLVAVLDRTSRLLRGNSSNSKKSRSASSTSNQHLENEDTTCEENSFSLPISSKSKILKKYCSSLRPSSSGQQQNVAPNESSSPSTTKLDSKILDSIFQYHGERDAEKNGIYHGQGQLILPMCSSNILHHSKSSLASQSLNNSQGLFGQKQSSHQDLSASIGCLTSVTKKTDMNHHENLNQHHQHLMDEMPLIEEEFHIAINSPQHFYSSTNTMNYEFIYEGKFENGFMKDSEGKFEFKYADRKGPTYVGNIENNRFNGHCKITWDDGSIYEGEVKNGLRDGYGIYTSGDLLSKYEGYWKQGQRHGKGIMYYSADEKYEGNFTNNKRDGYGVMHYKSGNYYEGQWQENKRSGYGVMHWTTDPLEIYEGEWLNDLPHGNGKHTYLQASGKKCNYYEGSFVEGKREGQGTFHYADGSSYSGEWFNNLKHGEGVFYYLNGSIQKGVWKEDKLHVPHSSESSVSSNINVAADRVVPNPNATQSSSGVLTTPLIELYINDLLLKVDGSFDELNKIYSLVQRNIRKFKKIFAHYCKYGLDPLCVKKNMQITKESSMNPRISIQGILNLNDTSDEMTSNEMKLFLSRDNRMTMVQFWKFSQDFGILSENMNCAQIDRIFIFVTTQSSAERNLKLSKTENSILQEANTPRLDYSVKPTMSKKQPSVQATPTMRFREFVESTIRISAELYRNIQNGTSTVCDRFRYMIDEKINCQTSMVPSELVSARSTSNESVTSKATSQALPATTVTSTLVNNVNLTASTKTTITTITSTTTSSTVVVDTKSLLVPTQAISTEVILSNTIQKEMEKYKESLKRIFSYYGRYEGGGYVTFSEEEEWHGTKPKKIETMTVKQFLRMLKDLLIMDPKLLSMHEVIKCFEETYPDIVTLEPHESLEDLKKRRMDAIITREMIVEDYMEALRKCLTKRLLTKLNLNHSEMEEETFKKEAFLVLDSMIKRFDRKP
ncbi:hypothetical protein FDP41_002226 [Naegleria fowleri]|uniref:Uncharacterized protein n=1 Tax=Naegleria fowleri TaxID=5763 RepID=A0A6A5BT89_NAEFO|nr:uncharacterized protein FDP41_002226 [Naegleria fowleri]KAF0978406.1 hypothetical protein FDP41_002226 [Naegleria fowleri]CAG4714724.1 unnamed protein product [Naegleria fowleri]